jgi:threonine/homoserine/homoserine lactone efflux protein
MPEFPPIAIAALTGFVSGFLLSIPVGPINLTIMNEGARRGFGWAALIGLGAVVMEVIYCAIAFTGFSSFFGNRFIKSGMELFSFAFMLYLGVKFIRAKTIPAHGRIEERLEERLHPHSAFMTGFVRTMGNPGVLLFWIILATNFMSREWVKPDVNGKAACIAGVAVGTGVWFFGLSWAVSLGHKKFSEKGLLRMEHFSGICLLGLGIAHGLHIAWQMANRKM